MTDAPTSYQSWRLLEQTTDEETVESLTRDVREWVARMKRPEMKLAPEYKSELVANPLPSDADVWRVRVKVRGTDFSCR